MATTPALPTLSASPTWRFATLAIMYSAQGLPFGLFNIAIPSWMAADGYNAADVASFIGIVSLPWSLKLIVAPLMDRWGYRPMGYRRPWVIGAQLGVFLSFVIFGFIPEELMWLSAIGCLTNIFAATQDVAVDGLAIDILPEQERSRANGFMFGGQYVGISLGASGGGYALLHMGLQGAGLLSALLMILVLLFPIVLLERSGERRFPWSRGAASARSGLITSTGELVKKTITALFVPASIILLLAQMGGRLAEGIIISHLPIYTVQTMGLDNTTYNDFSTIGGVMAAVLGVAISPWFDKIGSHRGFWFTCVGFVVITLLMPFTLDTWPMTTIAAHWVSIHLLGITLIATMMRFCHPAVAATQFAIYMAMANLNYSLGAFLYAEIAGFMNGTQIFLFAAALGATALPLWYLLVTRYLDTSQPQHDT